MNTILYDAYWENLLPLTYTRPIAESRIGILTLRQKWENYLNTEVSYKTQPYLSEKFATKTEDKNLLVNANIIATEELAKAAKELNTNEALFCGEELVAVVLDATNTEAFPTIDLSNFSKRMFEGECKCLKHPEQIFLMNGDEIRKDFDFITKGRKSAPLDSTNRALNPENIFMEEGAEVVFATLNAKDGPIYIGKNAKIMEGALVKGPLALCDNSHIKMGAKIYPDCTFGPHSKVGGEVGNSILFGYSNKGHDGYLGNSILGEWCNLGADTNNSNLKNDYTDVKIWDYTRGGFRRTGQQFCGLIMGDHSKAGINTMFNTGTVVGVSSNVFGGGFPRQFVPSFVWGGASGFQEYRLKKALQTADLVMKRRGCSVDEVEERILSEIFERSGTFRNF